MTFRHLRHHRKLFGSAISVTAAIVLLPASASAGTFDQQGNFTFDNDAVFTEGFEDFDAPDGMTVTSSGGLEGNAFVRIRVEDDAEAPSIDLSVGDDHAAYVVRAYVRSETSWYPTIKVTYDDSPGISYTLATMHPTGRMTSDGWVEIGSSPLSINGNRNPVVQLSMSSSDVDLDAVEVTQALGSYQPHSQCSGIGTSTCGDGQFCMHGYCQDGVAMVPPLPDANERSLYIDVLSQKLRVFFGGVASRKEPMTQALNTLDGLRDAANAWVFWNGIAQAVNELSDTHTRPFGMMDYIARGGRAFPVCLVEGDADLSHTLAPADGTWSDVLVSHVGPEKSLGLAPGDRIVAVDGEHPVTWVKGLVGHAWRLGPANDPGVVSLLVEQLASFIPAFATTIEVIRCDAATATCSAPETIEVASFEADTEETVWPECDHRPAYHLAQNNPDPVTHEVDGVYYGLLEDSEAEEGLYGMIWDDTVWWPGDPNPWEPAYGTFRADAKGLILDHRTGNGGSPEGAAYLTELSRQTQTVSVWSLNTTLGIFDEPFTTTDGLTLFNKWESDSTRSFAAGSASPREDMRIAVLLARDVSGSDFFPFGVKGSLNTRLFGRPTMGAFSTFLVFETASLYGFRLASGDFISASGVPQIGKGVQPDEVIIPKQSDLIVGKDTVYERALTWVRCGEEGCP